MTQPFSPRVGWRVLVACLVALASAAAAQTPAARTPAAPAGQPAGARPPYLNPALPVAQRVDDLVSRMTLDEKISQMRDHAAAIPRLGVPKYDWWNEACTASRSAGTRPSSRR